MPRQTIWTPVLPAKTRVIGSAVLAEADDHDEVTLYVGGEPLPAIKLASGQGATFLAECGLKVQPLQKGTP